MSTSEYRSLHDYYRTRQFKPTFAGFQTAQELDRYESGRRRVFQDLLGIPIRLFNQANVCEYGPDTGENALVFARWGARLTLVEPNRAAWSDIQAYFDHFSLSSHLETLSAESVETFQSPQKMHIINAEGFIYTIQPCDVWLRRFSDQLAPGGLLVANYLERSGCIFELLWSLLHRRYGEIVGRLDCETAADIFLQKWNSIPHTRTFESWVQDVLENPFVRLRYLIEPSDLLRRAKLAGFTLHSSWPRYEDPFHPYWHKGIPNEAVLEARRDEFITRSRLSFAFAKPLFVVGGADAVAICNRETLNLINAIDELIDSWLTAPLTAAFSAIEAISNLVDTRDVMASVEDRHETLIQLEALRRALQLLELGNARNIRDFVSMNIELMGAWGSTTHYVVLKHSENHH